MMELFI